MAPRRNGPRPGVFGTPSIRTGGFGALQVEALNNRPMSIARRHLAASELRMRTIEPDELSSSEWVRFLVMEQHERERWMNQFEARRRRNSDESTSSAEAERESGGMDKEAEARQEAGGAPRPQSRGPTQASSSSSSAPVGSTSAVSVWARLFDEEEDATRPVPRRPRHTRRVTETVAVEAPPTYETAVRSRTPPPAYEPRSDDEDGPPSSPPMPPRRIRWAV